MKRSKLFGIVCVIAMVSALLVAGCAQTAPPTAPSTAPPTEAPAKVFKLTLCVSHPAVDTMNSVVNTAWINWLERESGGRLEINLIPSAGGTAVTDLYDAARNGIYDITCQNFGLVPGRFPLQEVSQLPYIFKNPNGRTSCMVPAALYDKYPELQAEHKDVKVIDFHSTASGGIHTTKKPVHTVADYKGLVQQQFGAYPAETCKAVGGSPAALKRDEVFDALAKGTLDGVDINWTSLIIFGWGEALNYSTDIGACCAPFIRVMNLNTWNNLPPDLQALFNESYWITPELFGYMFDIQEAENMAKVEEMYLSRGKPAVYIPTDAERESFVKLALPVHETWVKRASAIIGEAKARAILADAKQFAEKYRYETTPVDEIKQTLKDWGAPGF